MLKVTNASGQYSHAEGYNTNATSGSEIAVISSNTTKGFSTHAEGYGTVASGAISHAEGSGTTASGNWSHAEGYGATASGDYSHAEGNGTTASGRDSHAEGWGTDAFGHYSHSEGYLTVASGENSHAEGKDTTISGDSSHVQGRYNIDSYFVVRKDGVNSFSCSSESFTFICGNSYEFDNETKYFKLKEIIGEIRWDSIPKRCYFFYGPDENTISTLYYMNEDSEYVIGSTSSYYTNVSQFYRAQYAHIIGNGTSRSARSNAHTLDWDGNAWYQGDVYVGSTSGINKDEGSKKLATEEYVAEQLANISIETPGEYTSIILKSSTEGSNKKFRITIDDDGILSSEEASE